MDPVTTTPRIWRIPVPIGPIPVVIPFRVDGEHYYIQKTWVGSASRGATTEAGFEALRHFTTPFQGGKRISDTAPGEERPVTDIAFFGPVEHYVLPDQKTIVNTTKPGHILYPGTVFRKVVQEGDNIYVVTEGYGRGIFPTLTRFSAQVLWWGVDQGVRNTLTPDPYPLSDPMGSGVTFGEIGRNSRGQRILTTGTVLPDSTVVAIRGVASVADNTASFANAKQNVSLSHPTGTTVQYPLGSAQLDVAANGKATVTVAGVNGGPTRNIIVDQPTGNVAITMDSAPGTSHTAAPGSLVTLEPSNNIALAGFATNGSQPRSWRNTVLDAQNRPIKTVEHVDWDRVGNGQAEVQTRPQYGGNGRPIGEPVQQVVAPNGAPPAQQPRVSAGQAIGGDPGSALGQAPAAARAPGQSAGPGLAIPADNAPAATAPAAEDDSAAAAAPQADGAEADQFGEATRSRRLSRSQRQSRKIGFLTAEISDLRRQLAEQGPRGSDDRPGAEPLQELPPQPAEFYRGTLADERASNADPMPEADAVRDDAESSRQQQAIDRAASRQQAVAAHLARVDEAKQRIPDFDQVIRSGGQVPIAPGVADEILNSEKSALLQYHLASNPDKLAELNGLSGLNLAREIGRLEGRLHLPTARTVTEASPPLSDVRGFAAPMFDPVKTDDMDAFADWLREDQARRRRA